jgi:hypothetical protein
MRAALKEQLAEYAETLRQRSDDMREAMASDDQIAALVADGPSVIYDLERVSKDLTKTLIYLRDEYEQD